MNNNHGRPPSARHQGSSNLRQAMSREALQQAQFHAAQELLARRQGVASAAQYHEAAYPSAALPNRGVYSMMRYIHSSNDMELPSSDIPYYLDIENQLPPSALLNHSRSRSSKGSIPPHATLHQAAMHHPLQHNASMVPSVLTPQSSSLSMNAVVQQSASVAWWKKKEEERRQTYMYRDFAKDQKANKAFPHQRSNYDQTFPGILYRVLSNPDFEDFISWLPHGRAFKIHKPEAVEESVLPLFFRGTKFSSFMRQVNGWGFRRMPTGPDRNAYYHEMFLRGLPHLCSKIRRPTTHKVKSSSDPMTHPNFYDTKTLVALPDDDMDSIEYGSNSGTALVGSIQDNQVQQATLFPEEGMFTLANLYNSTGGSDQDATRLGGKLNGSVVGTCSESGSNPDGSGSSEQGCGSDNGSSGCGDRSNTASPTIGGRISDGSDAASFERFVASVTRTNPSSGSDSGAAETTASGSSSSARKSSETSRSNGRYDTHSSNGNSSDGSGSGSGSGFGSFLHLLTATALHAAALNETQTPGFVMTGGNLGGDYSRDSNSSTGSDAGTEQVSSDMSRRFSGGSPRTRARSQQTMEERVDVARKGNNSPESSGYGDCSNSGSRSNGRSSDGADTSSLDIFDPSLSQTSRSSGSDSGGDAGTTTSDGSSSARKNSELSQPNGKSDTQCSNGNSSDGSASFLHLLIETASRAATLAEAPPPPAFVDTTDGNIGGDYSRDSSESDTGTKVSRSSSRGPPRKRAYYYYRQTSTQFARKKNSSIARYSQQDESSDDSSTDDHGRQH